MNRLLYIICFALLALEGYSQIGINTTKPVGILHIDAAGDNSNNMVNSDDIVIDNQGYLGIGGIPSQKLHIISESIGKGLRIIDNKQADNKVLTSNFDGSASWQYAGSIPTIVGVLSPIGIDIPLDEINFHDTGSYITLPPGRWFIQISMRAEFSAASSVEKAWIRTQFSPMADIEGPNGLGTTAYISGVGISVTPINIVGSVIINNESAANKSYNLEVGKIDYTGSDGSIVFLKDFGKNNDQNSIVAFQLL